MVTLTGADNALKTFYLGAIAEQLNTEVNPFLAQLEATSSDVWGKEIRKIAPYGLNGGIGAGTEAGTLPAAASNNYAQFVLALKNLYGTIEISDKAIRASSDNSGAFVNLLTAEMEGLVKASKFNFGRMLFGDGSGVLAKVTAQSGNEITLDNIKNVMEGMVIDILDGTAHTATVSGRRIVSVDRANKKIVIDGTTLAASTLSANDVVTVQGSYNNELTGLGAVFATSGTLYGLDKSTYKFMVPQSTTLSSALVEANIQTGIDAMDEVAGSMADFIMCSNGVRRTIQKLFQTSRSNMDVMDFKGGYRTITYAGIPIVSDRFAPAKTLYILNSKDFHIHQLCDWRWLEGDDGHVIKQVAGKPVYTATLVKYADMLCDRPIGQYVINNITEA